MRESVGANAEGGATNKDTANRNTHAMSHLVNPILCANFEDYDKYDEVSCTLKTWPDMWPEEIAAEAGLYRERKRMKEEVFFLARSKEHRTIQHFKNFKPMSESYMLWLTARALADVVAEYGWRVKNEDAQRFYGVSLIYATTFDPDLDEKPEPPKPKPQVKWNDWEPWEKKMLDELMTPIERAHSNEKQKWPDRKELQTYVLVELAAANGWKNCEPWIGRYERRINKNAFKIV